MTTLTIDRPTRPTFRSPVRALALAAAIALLPAAFVAGRATSSDGSAAVRTVTVGGNELTGCHVGRPC